MKSLIIFLFFCLQFLQSYSQASFQKTFGSPKSEVCNDIIQTFDGGFLFLSRQTNLYLDSTDILLIKTDEVGDTLWTAIIGQANEDMGMSLIQTADSGYAIAGYTKSFGMNFYHMLLIKLNNSGNILWTKIYGDNINNFKALDIAETPENNFVITGECPFIYHSVILLKTDAFGNLIWQKTCGLGRGDAVYVTADGSYVIVGYSVGGASASGIYIVKTDSSGTPIWNRLFDSYGDEEAKSIYQTSDNGFIIGGQSWGMGIGDIDIFALKLDSIGNLNWARGFGNSFIDYGGFVCPMPNGDYIVGFSSRDSINNDFETLLIKLNSLGDTIWTKSYGGNSDDFLFTVKNSNDGGLIIGGSSKSFILNSNNPDLYIIKMDSSLDQACNKRDMVTTVTIPALVPWTNALTSMNIGGFSDQTMQLTRGCTQLDLCNSAGMEGFLPRQNLTIYPNPSGGKFKVLMDQVIMVGELDIYNQLGQCIFNSMLINQSELEVNLSYFPNGIYFLKCKDEHNVFYGKVNVILD